MAIITLSAGACFPTSALGAALAEAMPHWRWTCDDDVGERGGLAPWRPHQVICGRAGDERLFVEIAWMPTALADGPPGHAAHVRISRPTTHDRELAERVVAVIAAGISSSDPATARVCFGEGGPWLDHDETERIARLVANGEPLASAIRGEPLPVPPPSAAAELTIDLTVHDDLRPRERGAMLGIDIVGEAQSLLRQARHHLRRPPPGEAPTIDRLPDWLSAADAEILAEQPRMDRLPTLSALFDGKPGINRALLAEALASIDPDAGWTLDGDSTRMVARCRAFTMVLAWHDAPLLDFLIECALHHSDWCAPGEALRAIRHHAGHIRVTSDLDTRGGRADATRLAAKAMAMALAVAARGGSLAGFHNAALNRVWRADDETLLVAPLANDEVPLPLFVAINLLVAPGTVSIATNGMLPFAGYEVEAWDAHGTPDRLREQVENVLRTLLANGPALSQGDMFGRRALDRPIRCTLATSRADRSASTPALLLDLAGPEKSVVALRPAQSSGAALFSRRTADRFGRKGV